MEASAFYNNLIADSVDNSKALTGVVIFGALTGLAEKLGLGSILDTSASRGILRKIRDFVAAGAVEGLTEYAENPLQAGIEGVVKNENLTDIINRILESLKEIDVIPGSFLLGGEMRAISARMEARWARDYVAQAEEIQKKH